MKRMKQTHAPKDKRIVIRLSAALPSRIPGKVGRSSRFGDKRRAARVNDRVRLDD